MGVVYKAEDTRLHRFVALKFLPDNVAKDPQTLARFQREAQAASALNHPNICTIHDIGEDNGRAYIAMEYLEGETLRHVIHERQLKTNQILDLGVEISGAAQCSSRERHHSPRHQICEHLCHQRRPIQDSRLWLSQDYGKQRG